MLNIFIFISLAPPRGHGTPHDPYEYQDDHSNLDPETPYIGGYNKNGGYTSTAHKGRGRGRGIL